MRHRRTQSGFTIVELMIATAIFSLILLVVLTAIVQVGRMYYKGITTAKTQEAARTIVERVAQQIQFSPQSSNPLLYQNYASATPPSGDKNLRCIGNTRYFYVINQLNTASTYGVWTDDNADGSNICTDAAAYAAFAPSGNPPALAGTTNPRDLLPDNMRIVKFDVSGSGKLYTISVRVAYGENDLLDQSVAVGGVPGTQCRGRTLGTQFCAVSEINVTVAKRL